MGTLMRFDKYAWDLYQRNKIRFCNNFSRSWWPSLLFSSKRVNLAISCTSELDKKSKSTKKHNYRLYARQLCRGSSKTSTIVDEALHRVTFCLPEQLWSGRSRTCPAGLTSSRHCPDKRPPRSRRSSSGSLACASPSFRDAPSFCGNGDRRAFFVAGLSERGGLSPAEFHNEVILKHRGGSREGQPYRQNVMAGGSCSVGPCVWSQRRSPTARIGHPHW